MEAKILALRRTGREEVFHITLVTLRFGRILGPKSARAEKSEKIPFFVEGSLSFAELLWVGAGAARACVLFVEVISISHIVALG